MPDIMVLMVLPQFPVSGLMNSKFIISIVAAVFLVSFLVGNWLNKRSQQEMQLEKVGMQYSACDPVMNSCQAMLLGAPVNIRFLKQPTALKPFAIEVRSDLPDIEEIRVDFRMQSMNMGVNFYRLEQVDAGIWNGQVTLPVCTSRRSDWVGELQVSYQGKLWIAEYVFTQAINN